MHCIYSSCKKNKNSSKGNLKPNDFYCTQVQQPTVYTVWPLGCAFTNIKLINKVKYSTVLIGGLRYFAAVPDSLRRRLLCGHCC